MPGVPKLVHVYVSSTFRDMHAEREVLETVVFPELRRRSGPLGIDLVKIDPCYRASEEAEGDAAVRKRLRLVEECRPYFIGLLGERYGRPLDAVPEELLKKFPQLAERQGLSVTELEILLATGDLSPHAKHAFFYLRDPRFLADVPPGRRGDFEAESADATARLEALKSRLRASGLAVDRYPCRWDPRADAVVGLEDFARQVVEDLWTALRRDRPSPDTTERSASHSEADPWVWAPPCRWDAEAEPPPAGKPGGKPAPYVDENVQFTVYRPKAVEPDRWYTMLAFAHLEELPADANPDEPGPVEEVKRQAEQVLGRQIKAYKETTQDSRAAVPREGEITFLPRVEGVTFNPPRRTFLWVESVHREEFRLRASWGLDGQTARGSLSVFLGSILLAEIPLSIYVGAVGPGIPLQGRSSARPYRKIFASYSHKDLTIVEEFERYARALGDEYLRDWVHLRAGEDWDERLARLIEEADVFQLFWSTNSMGSSFVEREWRHALSLRRPNFVRPTYWEDPLPTARERNLPPEELARLHFQRLTLNWKGPPAEGPPPAEGEPDIFEDDSDVPAPDDESVSEVVAMEAEEEADSGAATVARPRPAGPSPAAAESKEELAGVEEEPECEAMEEGEPLARGRPYKARSEAMEWVIALAVGLLVLAGVAAFFLLYRR